MATQIWYKLPHGFDVTFKVQKISKANYGFLNSLKKRMKLTFLSKEVPKGSKFRSCVGRIEDMNFIVQAIENVSILEKFIVLTPRLGIDLCKKYE